ncbi:glycosyltransferase [Shewanella sp. CG12_big_fil_rev_8_21_14_0_65_47_15]|uniref:glycosyltransferase n=1 Tax=Shewanella sp. CG12_big_fil_rev_8_21_14_0_65_47_15 TaxID=1975537 RepID=UPI000CC5845D|nr:glycosyltransferase [Shewanella sp. CG12_big_fil_rev_8_21_14_0_65_47_15]PIW59849.1 MAG: hypothetical protein COW15_15685 [Shewanella sp. CG12_big_fil_rev_8_21_14_0_65_47_15]
MNVVMVKYFFDTDSNYQINEMVKAWPKKGHSLTIITSKVLSFVHKNYDEEQKKKDIEYEQKHNIKIIRLDIWFKISSRVLFKGLRSTVDKLAPDVLFMHGLGDFNDVLYLYGKNNYLTFRDCHMSWVASRNVFAKQYYKFFSIFFAPIINSSKKYEKVYALGNEEKEYIKALGIAEERIEMLPHGYNMHTYFDSLELKIDERKNLGISDNDILISYIGKFDYAKQPHINLEIFSLLEKSFVDSHNLKFLFLGHKNSHYMEQVFYPLLNDFKYKDRVLVLPGVIADELNRYFNASDICLWPRETTLSSIHAQICGCKVIMENHDSNIERVVEHKNLFSLGSSHDAKDKLINLILNLNLPVDITKLKKREYNKQMKLLLESWTKILIARESKLSNRGKL